jgi:hypothetical protein
MKYLLTLRGSKLLARMFCPLTEIPGLVRPAWSRRPPMGCRGRRPQAGRGFDLSRGTHARKRTVVSRSTNSAGTSSPAVNFGWIATL